MRYQVSVCILRSWRLLGISPNFYSVNDMLFIISFNYFNIYLSDIPVLSHANVRAGNSSLNCDCSLALYIAGGNGALNLVHNCYLHQYFC